MSDLLPIEKLKKYTDEIRADERKRVLDEVEKALPDMRDAYGNVVMKAILEFIDKMRVQK